MSESRTDLTRSNKALAEKVLGDPAQYPDEFKAWIPRWVQQNVNFQLQQSQLPAVQPTRLVGETGNAAFDGAWVNYGDPNEPALYYIDPFKRVYIGGVVKDGVIGTSIFTLPAGYRPRYRMVYAVPSNDLFGLCAVNPDGTVEATAGSNVYLSLSGISFRQYV